MDGGLSGNADRPGVAGAVARLGAVIVTLLLTAGGCVTEERVVSSTWDNFVRDMRSQRGDVSVGGQGGGGSGAREEVTAGAVFAIYLADFTGPQRSQQAYDATVAMREQAGVGELWTAERDGVTTLYAGRFPRPDHPDARAMLAAVRNTAVDGIPTHRAVLAPVIASAAASDDEADLKNYSGYFTLQVEFYDDRSGADRRQVAMQRVEELREQGERAFYYHGPHRSMVTVGLFTRDDFVPRVQPDGSVQDSYGPAIVALRERFPLNLGNGAQVNEKVAGEVVGQQESLVVKAP